jgi:hypothetical protein
MRSPLLLAFALSAATSASACAAPSGEEDQAGSASAVSLAETGAEVLSSTSIVTGTLKLTAGGQKVLAKGLEQSRGAYVEYKSVFGMSCKPDTKGGLICDAAVAARDEKINRKTHGVDTSMLSLRLFASLPASSETQTLLPGGEKTLARQLDSLRCVLFPSSDFSSGDATCNLTFQDWRVETLASAVASKLLTRDQALDAAQDADLSLRVRE